MSPLVFAISIRSKFHGLKLRTPLQLDNRSIHIEYIARCNISLTSHYVCYLLINLLAKIRAAAVY